MSDNTQLTKKLQAAAVAQAEADAALVGNVVVTDAVRAAPVVALPVGSVAFKVLLDKPIYKDNGIPLKEEGGMYVVTDAVEIELLRHYASIYPPYVEEVK